MRYKFEWFEYVLYPTICLTANSKYKLVRVIGQIGAIIPLLPWTVITWGLAFLTGYAFEEAKETVKTIRKWWRNV